MFTSALLAHGRGLYGNALAALSLVSVLLHPLPLASAQIERFPVMAIIVLGALKIECSLLSAVVLRLPVSKVFAAITAGYVRFNDVAPWKR